MRVIERRASRLVIAALSLATLAPGCVEYVRPYAPLTTRVRAPVGITTDALAELAVDEGWRVIDGEIRRGHVEAVRAETGTSRDRVIVDVWDTRVSISVFSEVLDEGRWRWSRLVCAEYSYGREREIARALRGIARRRLAMP